jgi:hypothetical protein
LENFLFKTVKISLFFLEGFDLATQFLFTFLKLQNLEVAGPFLNGKKFDQVHLVTDLAVKDKADKFLESFRRPQV